MVGCSTPYPTSSRPFKDFSPKITCCLWHLQHLLFELSSPLSTVTRQTLLTHRTLPATALLFIPLHWKILCFLHLLLPFPYVTILFANYPNETPLGKVTINLQVPISILHSFSSLELQVLPFPDYPPTSLSTAFELLCWFILLGSTTNQMSFLWIKANGVTSH